MLGFYHFFVEAEELAAKLLAFNVSDDFGQVHVVDLAVEEEFVHVPDLLARVLAGHLHHGLGETCDKHREREFRVRLFSLASWRLELRFSRRRRT